MQFNWSCPCRSVVNDVLRRVIRTGFIDLRGRSQRGKDDRGQRDVRFSAISLETAQNL